MARPTTGSSGRAISVFLAFKRSCAPLIRSVRCSLNDAEEEKMNKITVALTLLVCLLVNRMDLISAAQAQQSLPREMPICESTKATLAKLLSSTQCCRQPNRRLLLKMCSSPGTSIILKCIPYTGQRRSGTRWPRSEEDARLLIATCTSCGARRRVRSG